MLYDFSGKFKDGWMTEYFKGLCESMIPKNGVVVVPNQIDMLSFYRTLAEFKTFTITPLVSGFPV